MSMKLKPITTTSWLVIADNDETRVGLLSEIRNQYILMIRGEKKQFINRKDVNSYFNEDIFNNVITVSKKEEIKKDKDINGYPVDFDNPIEILLKGNTLPLFSKKSTSDIYYCAGYYCIQFPKNWMSAYCPKFSTLETYKYIGPFKTEMEMRSTLTKLRKEKA